MTTFLAYVMSPLERKTQKSDPKAATDIFFNRFFSECS